MLFRSWEVSTERVQTSTAMATNKIAIKRNDTNEILAVVSERYSPVTNSAFERFVNRLSVNDFSFEGFTEFKGGKVILAFLKNNHPGLKLNNFPVEEYMVIGNSHDGSKPFYIGTSSRLIRCMNQFSSTLKIFRKKHTSILDLDNFSVDETLASYLRGKTELYDSFIGMSDIKVSDKVVDELIRQVHLRVSSDSRLDMGKIGKTPAMLRLRSSIEREMEALGDNLFGLFNGVTWYTTHELGSTIDLIPRINTTAEIINQEAYQFCIQFKKIGRAHV